MTEKKEQLYFSERPPEGGVTYQLPRGESVTMYPSDSISQASTVQSIFWEAWGREIRLNRKRAKTLKPIK